MSSPTTEIDTPKLLSLFKTNYEKRKLYYEDLFERVSIFIIRKSIGLHIIYTLFTVY